MRFAAGGLISMPVTIGVTALLHEVFALHESAAAAAGLVAALTANFLFLRYVVFASTATPILRQLAMFLASSGVFRGLEYVAFLLLNAALEAQYLLVLAGVLGVSFIIKFLVYENFVFARKGAESTGAAEHIEELER